MHREKLSQNRKNTLLDYMNVLHVAGVVLALVFLSELLYMATGVHWPQYAAYVLIAAFGVLLYRRVVNEWMLEIGEGWIRFYAKTGMRERLLVTMPVSAVDAFTPLPDTPIEKPYERFCAVNGPEKPWLLTGATAEGKACRVVFCPSAEAAAMLKECLDNRNE